MMRLFVYGLVAVTLFGTAESRVCNSTTECDNVKCTRHLDVAIVGAGPGGANSAYKLRDSGKTVGLFEFSDRVGGRLYTKVMANLPDLNLELGGMRFIDGAHWRLQALVAELGLNPKIFTEGFGRVGRTRYYVRGQSLTLKELKTGDVPYDLSPEEKQNQGRIMEYYFEKLTGHQVGPNGVTRDDLLKVRVADGRLLYRLTFDEALDMVATPEGKEFVKGSSVFTSEVIGKASVANIFDDYLGEDGYGGDVYTLEEGMSFLPQAMVYTFLLASSDNILEMNRHLSAIRTRSDGSSVLYFHNTWTRDGNTTILYDNATAVCARQVILAIPHLALSQLDWNGVRTQRALEALAAVRLGPASKVFMSFDTQWWIDNSRSAYVTKSDTDFSQMYDWKQSAVTGDYALIASYADENNTLYLNNLRAHGEPIPGSEPGYNRVTESLKNTLLDELAEAYDIPRNNIPEPKTSVSQFWTSYPFGCGWVTWLAGYHFDDVIATIRRPSLTEGVFVVGSDYSWGAMTNWLEGALETSDHVINDYFTVHTA